MLYFRDKIFLNWDGYQNKKVTMISCVMQIGTTYTKQVIIIILGYRQIEHYYESQS